MICDRNNAHGWFSLALITLCPLHHFPDIYTNISFNLTIADTAIKFTLLDKLFPCLCGILQYQNKAPPASSPVLTQEALH